MTQVRGPECTCYRRKRLSRSAFLIIYRKRASLAKFFAYIYDIKSLRNTSQTTFTTLLSPKPRSNLARVASIMINSREVPVAEYRSLHKSAGSSAILSHLVRLRLLSPEGAARLSSSWSRHVPLSVVVRSKEVSGEADRFLIRASHALLSTSLTRKRKGQARA